MSLFKRTLEPRPAGPGDPGPPVAEASAGRLERLRASQFGRVLSAVRLLPDLGVLGAGAALLNSWTLERNGWANVYYAAAVRSMAASWHNFFYASFDPSGVMSIDKPPLALWIEALSVRLFGYHSLSILIPDAVIGAVTVLLLYDLVRRFFGRIAGFVAGAALATTPVTVAMSRHNNPDALVALCCVAALWFFARAVKDGRTRWIVLAGVMIGLGFETKMGVAFVVVPGIVLAWLWLRPRGWHATLDQLVAGGFAMLVVSAAWPLFVGLTPASQRPWIAGTNDNSMLSLIFDYNGLGRVAGQSGGPTAALGVFAGHIGPVRLLNSALGGQAGWLLGLGLAGGIAMVVATRLRRDDPRSGWIIAVGGSFLVAAVLFSVAQGIFHPYYVSLLAPFTAAVVGAAVGVLSAWSFGPRLAGGLIAVAVVAVGIAVELVVLADYKGQLTWVEPLVLGVGCVASALLLLFADHRVRALALVAASAALMVAPAIWSVDTLGYATSSTFPAGGPSADNTAQAYLSVQAAARFGSNSVPTSGVRPVAAAPASLPARRVARNGFGASKSTVRDTGLAPLIAYVKQHGGGPIAMSQQQDAANAIIAQNADVSGIGGFTGRESSPTVAWLAQEVASGHIRWVFDGGMGNYGSPADGRKGDSTAFAAVTRACRLVVPKPGPAEAAAYERLARLDGVGLYDCAGRAAALALIG